MMHMQPMLASSDKTRPVGRRRLAYRASAVGLFSLLTLGVSALPAVASGAGPHSFTLGACVKYSLQVQGSGALQITVHGAPGTAAWGVASGGGQPGGSGGTVTASFQLTPGQQLGLFSGCTATNNNGGLGWAQGGASTSGGGAGGGASAICVTDGTGLCAAGGGGSSQPESHPLLVAGGGGGSGGGTCVGKYGWAGGAGGGSQSDGYATTYLGVTGWGASGGDGVAPNGPYGRGGANNGSAGSGTRAGTDASGHDGDAGGGGGMVGGSQGNDWGGGCQSQGGGGGGSSWINTDPSVHGSSQHYSFSTSTAPASITVTWGSTGSNR